MIWQNKLHCGFFGAFPAVTQENFTLTVDYTDSIFLMNVVIMWIPIPICHFQWHPTNSLFHVIVTLIQFLSFEQRKTGLQTFVLSLSESVSFYEALSSVLLSIINYCELFIDLSSRKNALVCTPVKMTNSWTLCVTMWWIFTLPLFERNDPATWGLF